VVIAFTCNARCKLPMSKAGGGKKWEKRELRLNFGSGDCSVGRCDPRRRSQRFWSIHIGYRESIIVFSLVKIEKLPRLASSK
jgi:hypothetical protein